MPSRIKNNPLREASIGDLFSRITVSGPDFEEGEKKLVKEPLPPFVRLCKKLAAFYSGSGKNAKFTDENKKAIGFLNWKLTPAELASATTVFAVLALLGALIIGTIVIFSPIYEIIGTITGDSVMALIYAYFPFLLIAMAGIYYFQTYPTIPAKKEQTLALTYVPEIMGYMVMSIKLVPNLEKAVEFSASHGRGKIAREFKELIWNTQIGFYNSISEGLDALAYRWGRYSEEFKKALMRVRASVIENSEAKRHALLDQTMSELLETIRNKMEQYARNLSQPSTMLFYIGVLLPLLLIIILPVGSSFSGAPLANPMVLFLIYNILIPGITIAFAYNLIQTRPPTYTPPIIPDNYPGLPPKWSADIGGIKMDARFAGIAVLVLGLLISFFLSTQGFPPKFLYENETLDERNISQFISEDRSKEEILSAAGREATYFSVNPEDNGRRYTQVLEQEIRNATTEDERKEAVERAAAKIKSEEQLFFSESENDSTPNNLIFGALITISIVFYIVLYSANKFKRKVQLEVQEMESEFKDSLYIIASRLGENKPIEDALKHVQEFLPDFKISQTIFARTLDNIKLLGLPLEAAVFDKNMGSVAKIPSTIIQGSMRMLIDSVQLGVNVAARTMISLSIQLQNSEKVNQTLKILVSEITNTMKTMTIFIAPIVLGITTSLQRIVIITLASLAASGASQSSNVVEGSGAGGTFSGLSVSSFISPEAIAGIASPSQFIFIVALYILELVIIMTYFTTKIEEDNDLLVKINIGRYMPIEIGRA